MARIGRIDVDLTTASAARYLGVDPRTLRRWTEAGRIPCKRTIATRRLYSLADLQRLLEEGARGA